MEFIKVFNAIFYFKKKDSKMMQVKLIVILNN